MKMKPQCSCSGPMYLSFPTHTLHLKRTSCTREGFPEFESRVAWSKMRRRSASTLMAKLLRPQQPVVGWSPCFRLLQKFQRGQERSCKVEEMLTASTQIREYSQEIREFSWGFGEPRFLPHTSALCAATDSSSSKLSSHLQAHAHRHKSPANSKLPPHELVGNTRQSKQSLCNKGQSPDPLQCLQTQVYRLSWKALGWGGSLVRDMKVCLSLHPSLSLPLTKTSAETVW